jgi:hypothetical protein
LVVRNCSLDFNFFSAHFIEFLKSYEASSRFQALDQLTVVEGESNVRNSTAGILSRSNRCRPLAHTTALNKTLIISFR